MLLGDFELWIDKLQDRFKPKITDAYRILQTTTWQTSDSANRKPIRQWAGWVSRLARIAGSTSEYKQCWEIWEKLCPELKATVDEPKEHTKMETFLSRLQAKEDIHRAKVAQMIDSNIYPRSLIQPQLQLQGQQPAGPMPYGQTIDLNPQRQQQGQMNQIQPRSPFAFPTTQRGYQFDNDSEQDDFYESDPEMDEYEREEAYAAYRRDRRDRRDNDDDRNKRYCRDVRPRSRSGNRQDDNRQRQRRFDDRQRQRPYDNQQRQPYGRYNGGRRGRQWCPRQDSYRPRYRDNYRRDYYRRDYYDNRPRRYYRGYHDNNYRPRRFRWWRRQRAYAALGNDEVKVYEDEKDREEIERLSKQMDIMQPTNGRSNLPTKIRTMKIFIITSLCPNVILRKLMNVENVAKNLHRETSFSTTFTRTSALLHYQDKTATKSLTSSMRSQSIEYHQTMSWT